MEKNEKTILSKILVCLYVVIALLAVNTIILLVVNGSATKEEKTTTPTTTEEENTDYDVSMFKTIDGSNVKIKDVFNEKDFQIIYIGRSTCGYCVKFLPTLQKAQEEYKYETKYIDISTISTDMQDELMKFDNDAKFLSQNFGSTPMVLLAKDGKLVDTWVGYDEYDKFTAWLDKNKVGE